MKCKKCKREFNNGKSLSNHYRFHNKNFFEKMRKYRLGRKHKKETKLKIGRANSMYKNGLWKGDDVGYFGLHQWIRRNKERFRLCECCKENKKLEIANISGKYKRDIQDYEWLCRKCHMKKDKRIENLKQYK